MYVAIGPGKFLNKQAENLIQTGTQPNTTDLIGANGKTIATIPGATPAQVAQILDIQG
jgi:hypothetical protein